MNEPYLTLEQSKDKSAQDWACDDWNSLVQHYVIDIKSKPELATVLDKRFNEAAELYASQFRDRLKELEEENKHFKGILQVVHNDVTTENEEGYLISDEAFRMIDRIKW